MFVHCTSKFGFSAMINFQMSRPPKKGTHHSWQSTCLKGKPAWHLYWWFLKWEGVTSNYTQLDYLCIETHGFWCF
jgi:hypothetical protein